MKNWKETTLGEISKSIEYGYTESSTQEKIGPKFLRITDIQDDFIDWKNVPYCPISERDHKKYRLEIGDVVIARTGNSTGATATIKENIDAVFASYLIRFKIDPEKADYNYIDFLLRSNFWKGFVKSVKGGSAQGGANAKSFAGFPILLPSLEEQKEIAGVLGSLDDKIELLREENKTLEATAQAIFKEWFVNFNFPNEEGKPYKSSGSKMIDSELGEIPDGWRAGRLSDIANFLNGLALQKFPPESKTEYLPIIKIKELNSGISDQTDKARANLDKKYIVENGDILFSWSGSLVVDIWKYGRGALNQHLFKVTSESYPKWFYFYWIKEHLASFQQIATAKAVTMGHIQRHHLDDALVSMPDSTFLEKSDKIFSPMLEKLINNNSEIQTLSNLRDALLPKLMNGDTKVK